MTPLPYSSSHGRVWAPDWKRDSYWLDDGGDARRTYDTLPKQVDVVIIGSGYTGLNAALETARAGRTTLVLDAEVPGWGCSTRNGGQISTSVKPSLAKLASKLGATRALAIRSEGKAALDWIEDRIATEGIACHFTRCGRFHAAHSPDSYETLCRDAQTLNRDEGIETHVVPRPEQRSELGTDRYHGGVVFPRHASLDPGRYHRGLLQSAAAAGVRIIGQCAVTGLEKRPVGHEVITPQGVVKARDVIVATNGYTGGMTPWMQRRVIPIGSYVIATEPLDLAVTDRLFPTGRIVSDTCKVVYYYRLSPDRRRVLFGGRVSATEADPAVSGPRLHEDMCRIFPELGSTRISHSWTGTVAYTFDEMAHTGVHDGVHYAMGYCGSGVSMASFLGMRVGQKVLGLAEGRTAFDDLPFPTRPLYTGRPWFLPAVVAWYRWRDRMQYENGQRPAG